MSHPLVRNIKTDGCDVYVGRPTKWGNPFPVATFGREQALVLYEEWINHPDQDDLRSQAMAELRGKTLGCYCAPSPCHAEVLAEIANS
jgi:hypothetical protein